MRYVFLAPVGRGGSILTHVLLANHPEIRTTECYVSLDNATISVLDKNDFAIKNICEAQLTVERNLWALDYQELGEKVHVLSDHSKCVCRRDVSEDNVNLIHVHNLFYIPKQIETFCKLIADKENCVLILCERDWVQTISSRQRTQPLLDLPRWISILYWVTVEDIARSTSQQLSSYVETLNINLLKWHTEPIITWEKLLSFIRITLTTFPTQPSLRGLRWGGGNKNENVVGIEYANYLTTNSLTMHETYAVQFMLKSKNSILLRPIREIIFFIADLVALFIYLTWAIKVLPKIFKTKACKKCNRSKQNRYSEIRLPISVDRILDYVRHVWHVFCNGGAYDYLSARGSIWRWKRSVRRMHNLAK